MRDRARRGLRWFLSVLGVLSLSAGLVAGVVHREVLDGGRFAAHADAIRTDDALARHLGERVSDAVLTAAPDLVAIRPLLESAASTLVASSALSGAFRSTVEPLHAALVTGTGGDVVLRLADVGALVVGAVNALDVEAAAVIPDELDVRLAEIGSGEATAQVIRAAHQVTVLSWLLPLLGALCLTAAGLLGGRGARSWLDVVRRGLWWVAGTLATVLLAADLLVSRADADTLAGALRRAIWAEMAPALWMWAGIVGVLALVLWLVAIPGFQADPRAVMRDLRGWMNDQPSTSGSRVSSAILILGLGVALVAEPAAVLRVALVGVGATLILLAARELLRLAVAAVRRHGVSLVSEISQRAVHAVAVGAVLAVLAGLVAWGAWPTSTVAASDEEGGQSADSHSCNGHVALCSRRYPDVAFPTTHNSMSAADEAGWFLAEQPTGVIGQLEDGIRAFLIDSWPGQVTNEGTIIANSEASRSAALDQARSELGVSVVESALRLRAALNLTPTGPVTPYLCHALCELGSTPWLPLMGQVRAWMAAHPREVVTFFIQDEVTPADTAQVFAEAGLTSWVHTPTPGEPWPTLAEMIDSGRRLVVLHEHRVDPAYPWILDGTVWSQDTPYDFKNAGQFNCRLFRGTAEAPLLLVNHWLNKPGGRIAAARRVNAASVLGERVEQCRRERGQMPTYVAVDYYTEGDLFSVVDQLNGVG